MDNGAASKRKGQPKGKRREKGKSYGKGGKGTGHGPKTKRESGAKGPKTATTSGMTPTSSFESFLFVANLDRVRTVSVQEVQQRHVQALSERGQQVTHYSVTFRLSVAWLVASKEKRYATR